MDQISINDVHPYNDEHMVARPLMTADKSNVRIIRLRPGQTLPPHTHGESDLFLYAVEGVGTLTVEGEDRPFPAASLAHYRGDEELRLTNQGEDGFTVLAFLAPVFPPVR